MDNLPEKTIVTETKLRPSSEGSRSSDKHSENRLANKQRKKRAHRRKLRRSHTKG